MHAWQCGQTLKINFLMSFINGKDVYELINIQYMLLISDLALSRISLLLEALYFGMNRKLN